MSLVTISCGDDPVSTNEDPPELPEFQNVEADISYFQNNPPQNSNTNYSEAYGYGVSLGSLTFVTQGYLGFFSQANSDEVEFKNGQWIWEYSYSFEGQSVSIKLIAEESGDFVDWQMLWSFDDGQGNSYTDYRLVEGSIAKDGTSGSWTFNSLNPDSGEEEPVFVSTWSTSGDDNLEIQSEFYDGGSLISTFNYSKNDNEFMVSVSEVEAQNDIIVFWDDSAMTGYLQTESDSSTRKCWDSNYEDVTCSSVGY